MTSDTDRRLIEILAEFKLLQQQSLCTLEKLNDGHKEISSNLNEVKVGFNAQQMWIMRILYVLIVALVLLAGAEKILGAL